MIDPTTLLAELAAIQRDVRTVAERHTILEPTQRFLASVADRCAALIAVLSAPPPVDNGMLAPIRARLDRMEREIAKLDERIERDRFDLDRRVMKLEARIDGGDPGDEQEAS